MCATYKRKSKECVDMSQQERVVITRRGKPAAILFGFEGKDCDYVSLPNLIKFLETYRGETKRVHSLHEGTTDPFEKAEKMNASVALFRFRGSGIPETRKFGLIRLENVRLCRFRSAGQVHWPISNQEYKHAENTRVEPKRDGCGTAEGLRRDPGNDGAGRQRTIGRLCVFAGPLAGSQRIERASS